MKEYLTKNSNGEYQLVNHRFSEDDIEVPEGAFFALNTGIAELQVNFYNLDLSKWHNRVSQDWFNSCAPELNKELPVLWQRHTQPEELPFIDDEPSVQATLNERQSSYGCFEDVALVTENIIDALKQVNYSKMPKTHKMAMYMIASKMARIVNGDFNHKDSWHDIQGYAKLIEDLL